METPIPRTRRQLPEKIGRYRVVGRIGKGAMGIVYSAYDDVMERSVAIKVMMADVQDDPETSTRFFREAHAAGQLLHRNIITIFDLGDDDGRPYIVMELLDGQILSDYLKRPEGLELEDKVALMLQVCDGLRLAHGKGIFHRDIKPGNLLVTNAGDLKILDFGIARLATSSMTMSGLIVGTPDYMSPEQACGREVDQRADIFSAGAVFYLMLTGRKPFAAPDLPAVLMKVQNEDPLPIRETEAPPSLAAAVMKALAKSVDARYQTVAELIADLHRVSRELARETGRLGDQARRQFEAAEALAAELQELRRQLGVHTDHDDSWSLDALARSQFPVLADWLNGGKADALYCSAAQSVVHDATTIYQSLADETSALRQAIADVQAGAAAAEAGEWLQALTYFDAVANAVPACAGARDEGNRLRRLIAEKQAADDRRRALLDEAAAAAARADWSAVSALAESVLASDSQNPDALALRQAAATAVSAEARRRRQQCEQLLARAEQLARKGRYDDADRAINEAGTIDPESRTVAEVAERVRTARLDAERASERERRAAEVIAAARTTFNQGDRTQAIAALRALLEDDPQAAGAAATLRDLSALAARLEAEQQRRAQAAEQAQAAEAALSADQPDQALTLARNALGLAGDDQLARKIQGLATARLRELKAAKERQDQIDQLVERARTHLERRKYDSARDQARSAAALAPSDERIQALLAAINEAEAKANEEERQEREARQRQKAAAPMLVLAHAAEAAQDLARAAWLAENALALSPECTEAREIMQRAQARLSAEPELADETVNVTSGAKRKADIEDTVTLVPEEPAWRRLAGLVRSWIHSAHREGA